MLQVYVRAYRLYVLTNEICQMLQSWDKLFSASSSTKIHRDCGITVRSRVNLSNIKQKCGPLPTGSVNLNKLNLIEIELFIKMLYGVWSSLQPDHDTSKSPRRMQVSPPAEERWQVADLKAETFEDLWYLFSSEDKYKGFFLYQREDWLIDWNQLINFKCTQVFLCCQSFDRRGQWIF